MIYLHWGNIVEITVTVTQVKYFLQYEEEILPYMVNPKQVSGPVHGAGPFSGFPGSKYVSGLALELLTPFRVFIS